MPTSARTTTSASAASAARSPTTSASSATSASKSPSSASPAPAPNQAEHTTRPPDPGRHLHPAPLTLHRVLPHAQLISIFRVSWRYARPPAHQGLGYSGRSCNQAARPNVQGDEGTLRWQVPGGRKAASWAERHSRAAYRAGGSVHLFSIPREPLHGGPCDDPGQGLYGVAARRLGAALHLPAGVRRRGAGLRLPPCACRADPGRAETPVALSRTAARPALPCLARHPVQHLAICGIALGTGPVRVLAGSTRRGIADLMNPTSAPPWLALKTLWFSLPAYQGPFVIRATRLGRPGPVALGEGPAMVPLVIPAGPTLNSFFGYRTVPGGLWVKSPGCYA